MKFRKYNSTADTYMMPNEHCPAILHYKDRLHLLVIVFCALSFLSERECAGYGAKLEPNSEADATC